MSEMIPTNQMETEPLHDMPTEQPGPLETPSIEYTAEQLMRMAAALEPFTARNVSRRAILSFGKAACTLAAANSVLHYAERPVMDLVYAQHDTKLIYSGTDVRRPVKHAGLASQGWGITRSSSIVNALLREDVYTENFPFAAYRPSSKKVTKAGIEECGRKFVDVLEPQEADVHAVSEGLMIALTGARAAGKHVRLISSFDSPIDIDDAYHSTLAKGVALADQLGIYHGGIFGKIATCLLEEIDREGFHEIFTGWFHAIHSALTGGDPRMMVSQITFMEETNLLRDWRSFSGILDKDTQAVILRTKIPGTDPVVKDVQAEDKLREMYDNLGIEPVIIEVDEPGHAKTDAGIAAGAAQYKRVLADAA